MAGQRGARPNNDSLAPFGTCLLVSGPEGLLAERAVAARIAAATQQVPDAEVTRVAAVDLEGNRLAELTGGSLFSAASVVVIEDLANLSQDLFDAVLASAVNPGEDLSLTLVHGGGQKGKGLLDKLKKAKVPVSEAAAIKTWELPRWVSAEARRIKVGMDAEAAQALVDAVGSDLRALAGAVSQLGSDWEGQNVTAQMIARYFAGRADVTSFAVADDIMGGRPGPALEKLRWALSTGVAPVLVTSAVASSLRGLGKYLDARSARLSEGEMAREVGVPPWKLKDLSRLSRSWSPRGVSQALRAVATADAQVKGAASDPHFALEQLLLAVDRAHGMEG
ncbi:DNA polymerase III subunit delta [Luteococcus sp. H138]|uniref:DNA polymerase III subunit delta n=1 Tax=unclassified Luteococcus TaxID=2639923 RepID=UPI00313BAB5E